MRQYAILGGLTLAIALQRQNIDVKVYESAPQWKPLGAGIGLAGNRRGVPFIRKKTNPPDHQDRELGKMAQWQNPLMTSVRKVMISMMPKRLTENQFKFIYDVSLR